MQKIQSQFTPYISIFREFIKNIQQIGAVVPDSNAIVSAFCDSVPIDPAKVIVEYGPGTGTVSRGIISRKHSETTLICFEKNLVLYKLLKKSIDEKNVFLVNEDAFDSPAVLAEQFNLDYNSVDCFISTLPNTFLDYDHLIRDKICPLLKKNGLFVTYQYVTAKVKCRNLNPVLSRYFHLVGKKNIIWNFPPATVYTCQHKKVTAFSVDNSRTTGHYNSQQARDPQQSLNVLGGAVKSRIS